MDHKTAIFDLNGGAKLLVINLPVSVSLAFDIYVHGGFRSAPVQKYELPHLLEHLAFEGNELYPDALQFKTEVEKEGAYFNAYTTLYQNIYEFVGLTHELERIVKLGLAQVLRPIFKESAIDHERQVVINELTRNRDDYARLRWELGERAVVGQRLPILKRRLNGLEKINQKDIKEFYAGHYVSKQLRFVLAGTFKPSEITQTIEQINHSLTSVEPGVEWSPELQLPKIKRVQIYKSVPVKDQTLFFAAVLAARIR